MQSRIAYHRETLRRTLSTFRYSSNFYSGINNSPTVTGDMSLLSGEFTINGYSIRNLLGYWLNPLRLMDELARWSVSFDLKNPPKSWAAFKAWFHFKRTPTLREVLESFTSVVVALCKHSVHYTLLLVKFLKSLSKTALATGVVLLGLMAIMKSLQNSVYKVFDPTIWTNRHRPGGPGALAPPEHAAEVHEIEQQMQNSRREAALPYALACCKGCHNVLEQCICKGYLPAMREQAHAREKQLEYFKNENKRRNLINSYRAPGQFAVGDSVVMRIDTGLLTRILRLFSINAVTTWRVSHVFDVADTRPLTEQHITVGNVRYYIIESSDVSICHSGLGTLVSIPRDWLSIFSLPARDLIVNEDHFRLQRRGLLLGDFEKTLKMNLETMLSVPICDPAIKKHGCNPLRDGYLAVRAFADEHVIPRYADF